MKILFLCYAGLMLAFKPIQLTNIYATCFLYALALQDYKTMYISKVWIFPTMIFYVLCATEVGWINRILTSGIFFLVCMLMKYKHTNWIGSADVWYLTFFSFFLGYERMLIALWISLILGFIWMIVLYIQKKECILPYLCCLSIGVFVAWLKGYTLFYFILNLFSSGA